MVQPEHLTVGIREILFGQLKPVRFLKEYDEGKKYLYANLLEKPQSSEGYIQKSSVLFENNPDRNSLDISGNWVLRYRKPIPDSEKPFHPLCKFYTTFTECECLLMIQQMIKWQEELELTLLKYHLRKTHQLCTEYLKEIVRVYNPLSNNGNQNLQSYVINHLFRQLLAVLFDIDLRFGHLFEERIVTRENFFPLQLEIPVPNQPLTYLTTKGAEYLVISLSAGDKVVTACEEALKELKMIVNHIEDSETLSELYNSAEVLENAWLAVLLHAKSENGSSFAVSDIRSFDLELERSYQNIRANKQETDFFQYVIDAAFKARDLFVTFRKQDKSLAAVICSEILQPVESDEDPQNRNGSKKLSKAEENSGILDEYIEFNNVKDKLGVTDVTINKYLKKASVPIIQYSQKIKFIHRDDVRKMMDYFKEEQH